MNEQLLLTEQLLFAELVRAWAQVGASGAVILLVLVIGVAILLKAMKDG